MLNKLQAIVNKFEELRTSAHTGVAIRIFGRERERIATSGFALLAMTKRFRSNLC